MTAAHDDARGIARRRKRNLWRDRVAAFALAIGLMLMLGTTVIRDAARTALAAMPAAVDVTASAAGVPTEPARAPAPELARLGQ